MTWWNINSPAESGYNDFAQAVRPVSTPMRAMAAPVATVAQPPQPNNEGWNAGGGWANNFVRGMGGITNPMSTRTASKQPDPAPQVPTKDYTQASTYQSMGGFTAGEQAAAMKEAGANQQINTASTWNYTPPPQNTQPTAPRPDPRPPTLTGGPRPTGTQPGQPRSAQDYLNDAWNELGSGNGNTYSIAPKYVTDPRTGQVTRIN